MPNFLQSRLIIYPLVSKEYHTTAKTQKARKTKQNKDMVVKDEMMVVVFCVGWWLICKYLVPALVPSKTKRSHHGRKEDDDGVALCGLIHIYILGYTTTTTAPVLCYPLA